MASDNKNQTIKLKAVLSNDSKTIIAACERCKNFHVHGSEDWLSTVRSPHCDLKHYKSKKKNEKAKQEWYKAYADSNYAYGFEQSTTEELLKLAVEWRKKTFLLSALK